MDNAEAFCSYRYIEISKMVEHNTQHVSHGKDALLTIEIFVWILINAGLCVVPPYCTLFNIVSLFELLCYAL